MSIIFHSIDPLILNKKELIEDVYVPGMFTRAYTRTFATDMVIRAISPFLSTERYSIIFDLFRGDQWILNSLKENVDDECKLKRSLALYFNGMGDNYLMIEGEKISCYAFILNTLMRGGGDVMRLLARFDGQCEIWPWIDGKDRAWVASIIQEGIENNILGDYPERWEEVIKLSQQTDESEIVLSYSVTEPFPNSYLYFNEVERDRHAEEDEEDDKFYDLDPAVQWDTCLKAIQKMYGESHRINRKNQENYNFGANWDAFKLRKYLFEVETKNEAKNGKNGTF